MNHKSFKQFNDPFKLPPKHNKLYFLQSKLRNKVKKRSFFRVMKQSHQWAGTRFIKLLPNIEPNFHKFPRGSLMKLLLT